MTKSEVVRIILHEFLKSQKDKDFEKVRVKNEKGTLIEGFYPLGEALNLYERKKQWDVQKAEANLAVEVPYERYVEKANQMLALTCKKRVMHPS